MWLVDCSKSLWDWMLKQVLSPRFRCDKPYFEKKLAELEQAWQERGEHRVFSIFKDWKDSLAEGYACALIANMRQFLLELMLNLTYLMIVE